MNHALRKYKISVGKPEREGPLDICVCVCGLFNDPVRSSVPYPIDTRGLFPWGYRDRA
jgi:hypothetical protein